MKKFLSIIIILVIFISLAGCAGGVENYVLGGGKAEYTVTFVVDKNTYKTVKVSAGEMVEKPKDPKKNNYLFMRWCSDSSMSKEYDFTDKVYKNTTLYAYFNIDGAKITNEITTNYIHSVFTVKAISSKTVYERWDILKIAPKTYSAGGQGSGVCFYKNNNGSYFILTNCHVAQKISGYTSVSYTVEDYQGKTYTAYLYKNPDKSSSAISADYDLACLYFKPSVSYPVLSVATADPAVGSDVIAMGTPKSQGNAIAFGKVISYDKTVLKDTATYLSNVNFSVISHNAFIDRGSSGGPLMDANYRIVGINYAGAEDNSSGRSVPAKKIKEFLDKYVYN